MSLESRAKLKGIIMLDLSKKIAALQDKIRSVGIEFNQVVSEIEQAEAGKQKAKADYQAALSAGLENQMSNCLSTVRQTNQEIESLRSQLGSFPGKVSELYAEQGQLVKSAREECPKAEAAFKQAQENMKAVEAQIDHAGQAVLGELNSLNDLVDNKIHEQVKP